MATVMETIENRLYENETAGEGADSFLDMLDQVIDQWWFSAAFSHGVYHRYRNFIQSSLSVRPKYSSLWISSIADWPPCIAATILSRRLFSK